MFEEFRGITKNISEERDEFDELIEEINKEEKRELKNLNLKQDINDLNKNFNIIEIALNIFTIEKGIIKVLLIKKTDEPYKGHWILPSKILKQNEDITKNLDNIIYFDLKLDDIYTKQTCFLSNINTSSYENSVVLSYLGIINIDQFKKNVDSKIEYGWFPINDLPKIAYQYSLVITKTKEYLKEILIKLNKIKLIFPNEFSMSELQNSYEQLLNEKFDRRNFRKKFIKQDLIEETGLINEYTNGRPAKLYKFKEKEGNITLF